MYVIGEQIGVKPTPSFFPTHLNYCHTDAVMRFIIAFENQLTVLYVFCENLDVPILYLEYHIGFIIPGTLAILTN